MIRGWWRETKSKRSAGQSTPSGINYIHLSCSRLGGQDQAEVQHQQTILEQSGDKTKRITQNYSWLSTKTPSSEWWFVRTGCFCGVLPAAPPRPQSSGCLWVTGSDPGGDLRKPHPPAGNTEALQTTAAEIQSHRDDQPTSPMMPV